MGIEPRGWAELGSGSLPAAVSPCLKWEGAGREFSKNAASALPTYSHPWHPQTPGSVALGVGSCPREPPH